MRRDENGTGPAEPKVSPAVRGSDPAPAVPGGTAVRGADPAPDAPADPAVRVPGAAATAGAAGSAASADDQPVPPPPAELAPAPLLPTEERDKWALRLHRAVSGFIDEPRKSVEEADAVLGETAARVAELVKERRQSVSSAKDDTEELRLALRDYRQLTERMLEL
ncbi:hypothetical protein [Streptomyces sp. TLI_146]|uniref:hypothetical protein n=1 Tax=Streptomyces sp. TLI_146 TaxID=1938858 RepID=UPI000C7124B8|nr:hypothetical protein [Streptomyces sp. TLI_146]PKV85525.1 hypothetical protein BX283_3062 [Streptomyces sp. TLI_146]